MMYVKKWPKKSKSSKYVLLNIIQKCKHCGTVVEIDNLNDLEYGGYFSIEGGLGFFNTLNHRYEWKYICPYCNKKESLSDKNLDYVTKFIDSNDIDMKPYETMPVILKEENKEVIK